MINSICIVRLSAMGDVLMLVPLVRTLQASFPQAKLTWIISKPAYEMVEGMDGVEFILIDKPKNLIDYWRFKKRMASRCFDVLLATHAAFRANLLYPLINAKRKIGYDVDRATDGHGLFIKERIQSGFDHETEGFLRFAAHLGAQEKIIRWDLPIANADHEWAAAHLPQQGPILVVNPAASKPKKSWTASRYVALLLKVQKKWQVHIVLTGGPGEFDRLLADQISQALPVIDLVGKTKPKQLLAVLSRATAVLCPDTGPSHMAAAVNTPVVALHAASNPLISGPYTFQHLVVNRYPQAVEKFLGKKYDHSVWRKHVYGVESMELIQVDDVMEKLAEVL